MKNLILLRGLPGSGKSTLAKMLVGKKEYYHKEADMFFVDRDGNYNFQPSKIKDSHAWCQEEVEFLLNLEHSPVVVSNTFTQEWEMKPYIDLANQYGYTIFTIIVENRHGNSNVHNVPEETIEKMKNRFEIKI
jgi:predicted kinase